MIAALYVQKGGCYYGLPDVDPWPEARDARLYAGPWPVVAHPPCAAWSRMAGFREKVHGRPRGQDGGCFAAALASVREWGGVLEHPAYSKAWAAHGLPPPAARGGWQHMLGGGWTAWVDQGNYGHPLPKPTWLYVARVTPPTLRWGRLSNRGAGRAFELMSHKQRAATPPEFRDLLLGIARSARGTM